MIDDHRAAFEAWISGPPNSLTIERYPKNGNKHEPPGEYRDFSVQLAWEAWCRAIRVSSET